MANFVYNEAKEDILLGDIAFASGLTQVVLSLCMSNTTCDIENDGIVDLTDFTTIDEFDGSGYFATEVENVTVTKNDANDRAIFDGDNVSFGSIGVGTRDIVGSLIWIGSTNKPLIWLDWSSSPVTPDGSIFKVNWNSIGISLLN